MTRIGMERSRSVDRLAHAFLPVTAIYVAFKIFDVVVFGSNTEAPSPLVGWGLWGPVAFFVTLSAALSHERGPMCPRCAAEMPVDPEAMLERRQWWLRLHHLLSRTLPSTTILVGMCVATVALSLVTENRWWITADFVYAIVWAQAFNVHRTLRPWCPWCRSEGRHGRHGLLPSTDPERV